MATSSNVEPNALAISMRDVVYRYPGSERGILGVSCDMRRGERVAILGANGAGKSTLLLLIAGLVQANGLIQVLGETVTIKGGAFRRHLGLMFQDPNDQLFCPSIYEDVAFGPRNMGLSRDDVAGRVHAALTDVGLHGFESRSPLHLSIGERKRAALATVLSMSPSILLLDEPTAGLDPRGRREIAALFRSLADSENRTLVFATHDLEFAKTLSHRAILMREGKVVADRPTNALLNDSELLAAHGMA